MSDWDVVSLAFSGSEPNPDRNDAWPLQTRHACLDLGKSLSLPLVGYVCAYIVRLHIGYVPMQTHVAPRVVVRVCVCVCVRARAYALCMQRWPDLLGRSNENVAQAHVYGYKNHTYI